MAPHYAEIRQSLGQPEFFESGREPEPHTVEMSLMELAETTDQLRSTDEITNPVTNAPDQAYYTVQEGKASRHHGGTINGP